MQQLSLRSNKDPELQVFSLFDRSSLMLALLCLVAFCSGNLLLWYGVFIAWRSSKHTRGWITGLVLAMSLMFGSMTLPWQGPILIVAGVVFISCEWARRKLERMTRAACFSLNMDLLNFLVTKSWLPRIPGSTGLFWRDCKHALAHTMTGDGETSEYLMTLWRSQDSLSADAFILLSKRMNNDLAGAAKILDQLVGDHPDVPWCPDEQLVEMALIYVELGRWRKAIYLLDNAKPKKHPSLKHLYAFLGEHYAAHTKVHNDLVADTPAEQHYYDGVRWQAMGNADAARAAFGACLKAGSDELGPGCGAAGRAKSTYNSRHANARLKRTLIQMRAQRRLQNMASSPQCTIWPEPDAEPEWVLRQLGEVERHWWRYSPFVMQQPMPPIRVLRVEEQ